MAEIMIEGAWYSNGMSPEVTHFVPTGLPIALCGAGRGQYQWPRGVAMAACSECSDSRASIEAEMADEAAQQPPLA